MFVRRRDRQNEIVVALIVTITMAFALVFSILLTIDDTQEDETPVEGVPTEPPTIQVAQVTITASPTLTASGSPTVTNTATSTNTATVTNTVTVTSSDIPTDTVTATNTATQTDTATATNTATATDTPSRTPSNTPSDTPKPSSTYTPTATLTHTPRPTRTTVAVEILPSVTPSCTPRTDWEIYIVDIDETFFSIAQRYEMDVETLAVANCISNPSRIYAGQPIRVPDSRLNSSSDAAFEGCNQSNALITVPQAGESLQGEVVLRGVAHGEGFRRYIIDWRPDDPQIDFKSFEEVFEAVLSEGELGTFNTNAFAEGLYWFRLRVLEQNDYIIGECVIRVRFR